VFLSFFLKRQEGKGLVYVPLTDVPNVPMWSKNPSLGLNGSQIFNIEQFY
jgi:hypothetical protein